MIQAATTSRQPRAKAPGWYHMALPLRGYLVDDRLLRQYVIGDGIDGGRAQMLDSVFDRLAHGALHLAAVRRRTAFQQRYELAPFPPADAGRGVCGDIGNRPSVGTVLGAGKLASMVAPAKKIAGGMALAPLGDRRDEIRPPLLSFSFVSTLPQPA